MFHLQEIRRQPDGLSFDQKLDLLKSLQERNPEILDLQHLRAVGKVTYEKGLYFLDYQLSYEITLASSRSLEPVVLEENRLITEVFGDSEEASALSNEEALYLLPIEGEGISLEDSVADNILLEIPLKVLTPEEETEASMPQGQSWQVLSEEDYLQQQAEAKKENSPFASLQDLFTED
ncbi:DUF177 domain-containing protein [Streptococcus danieliae]|uniref:DUF177 domain-containing protein n=1 Tax=Streptococcus danieliae TaxID=747656 RepID=A0A7Z0RS12_9STRE|nr:YceD family protein [Streptococcus danieliae]MBF0717833.1 DUF177 domain-containing protein [Streptococcus danieliae]NYS49763.1 DUF177 domain-containing protein [Streptococcus danieliae]